MRVPYLLAALLAGLPLPALAQTDSPMELGLPGDTVFVNPSAFVSVETFGDTLLLQAHPGFVPVVADYTANAPQQQITVSICGVAFPPFSPIAPSPGGLLEIPLGTPETATAAAAVMAGDATCESFAGAEAEVTITELLPTPAPTDAALSGLTITSPSDTYEAMVEEVMEARVVISPYSGGHVINLTFGPGLAAWFAIETGEHIGDRIALSVCGEVVTDPTVQEAITGGEIQITGSFQKAEAEVIAARIRGDIPCG